ncbi:Regulatory protein [Staphylococcus aureus]|uniref:Regulatory protein n=1 Tax=Staphylococcus aureus TaxID=1280 RepID=A0A2X2KGF6_STAAU|nr:Regulatory protein [Staphylococcus aureus]
MSNAKNADNKQFFSKILNSIGAGVVIALVPNALLGEVLKIFKSGNEILELTYQLVILIPIIYGIYYWGFSCSSI